MSIYFFNTPSTLRQQTCGKGGKAGSVEYLYEDESQVVSEHARRGKEKPAPFGFPETGAESFRFRSRPPGSDRGGAMTAGGQGAHAGQATNKRDSAPHGGRQRCPG